MDGKNVLIRAPSKSKRLSVDISAATENDRRRLTRMELERNGRPFLVSAQRGTAEWLANDNTFLTRTTEPLVLTQERVDRHSTTTTFKEV